MTGGHCIARWRFVGDGEDQFTKLPLSTSGGWAMGEHSFAHSSSFARRLISATSAAHWEKLRNKLGNGSFHRPLKRWGAASLSARYGSHPDLFIIIIVFFDIIHCQAGRGIL